MQTTILFYGLQVGNLHKSQRRQLWDTHKRGALNHGKKIKRKQWFMQIAVLKAKKPAATKRKHLATMKINANNINNKNKKNNMRNHLAVSQSSKRTEKVSRLN